jgi:hypothetical protein
MLPTRVADSQEPDQGVRLRTRASAPHGFGLTWYISALTGLCER